MKKFKFYIEHDYEIFPTIVELEAEDQFNALRKLSDLLESKMLVIGTILKIELKQEVIL